MRRRAFIEGIAALAAALWPLAARAQLSALPKVGFLRSSTLADVPDWVTAFRQGLKEAGFVEGQNVAIEFRTADNQPDRLPVLVPDLIHQPVAVIVGNTESALAANAATHDGADRLRDWERPGQRRPRGQPQPARRQRHRRVLFLRRGRGEADWSCCDRWCPRSLPCL
jgi:hypothetical protein